MAVLKTAVFVELLQLGPQHIRQEGAIPLVLEGMHASTQDGVELLQLADRAVTSQLDGSVQELAQCTSVNLDLALLHHWTTA